jgi:DNA-binding NtrC family response regulator
MVEILLIDDDVMQLRLREALLRDAGLAVRTASTAEEALASLHDPATAKSLRLIVTDHVMPGAKGAAFVSELRQVNPGVNVIVVSGFAQAEEEYKDLDVSFLNKPCPPEEFIRQVRDELWKNSQK